MSDSDKREKKIREICPPNCPPLEGRSANEVALALGKGIISAIPYAGARFCRWNSFFIFNGRHTNVSGR